MSAANILVVDDDPDIRTLVAIALGMSGHTVAEATNGEEALGMVASGDYDLMVLDVNMPRMSGLEVAQRLRRDAAPRRPLILMLSAMASEDDIEAGLVAGADEYATKPFPIAHLSSLVDRMLETRKASAR